MCYTPFSTLKDKLTIDRYQEYHQLQVLYYPFTYFFLPKMVGGQWGSRS